VIKEEVRGKKGKAKYLNVLPSPGLKARLSRRENVVLHYLPLPWEVGREASGWGNAPRRATRLQKRWIPIVNFKLSNA
jgi:hypothetical protein